MLNQELEKASRDARRKRIIITTAGLGMLTVGAVAVFAVSMYAEVQELKQQLASTLETPVRQSPVQPPLEPRSSAKSLSQQSKDAPNQPKAGKNTPPVLNAIGQSRNIENSEPDAAHTSDTGLSPTEPRSSHVEHMAAPLESIERLSASGGSEHVTSLTEPTVSTQPHMANPQSVENSPTASVPLSPDEMEQKREAFKDALRFFDAELNPQIETEDFRNWAAEAQKDITFLKGAAITAFSAGDFDRAHESISQATNLAKSSLNNMAAAFETALSNAAGALKRDDAETASQQISKALALNSGSETAQKLSMKIEALPKILEHLEAANVARVENDLKVERMHLLAALKLDSSRTELHKRADKLETLIKEREFAAFIMRGGRFVRERQLSKARTQLEAAQRIYPRRDEVAMLRDQIATLDIEIKTQEALAAASIASSKDNWQSAKDYYTAAKKLQPNNQHAVDGLKLAAKITEFDSKIATHLAAPDRLASSNVAAIASGLISEAGTVRGHSENLDKHVEELRRQLATFVSKVPVIVISDGFSHVSVRGVGRVGVTTGKTIELRPGEYTFESTRPGYRSKLIRVAIPPGTDPVTVTIFSDERI